MIEIVDLPIDTWLVQADEVASLLHMTLSRPEIEVV